MEFIKEQEYFLAKVRREIQERDTSPIVDINDLAETMRQLKEDIKSAKPDDLPHLYHQLNLTHSLGEKFSKQSARPDIAAPYFAFIKLREKSGEKIIMLGHQGFSSADNSYRIVDWKRAPIAKVFYEFSEGEEFEIDTPVGTRQGIVEISCLLTIEGGELFRIDRAGESYLKNESGWEGLKQIQQRLAGGEGRATQSSKLGTGLTALKKPDVLGLLDRTQYKILEQDPDIPLLLIGGAGSGKTTVALFRLALLASKFGLSQDDMIVVVPVKGLVKLSKEVLASARLKRVKVIEYNTYFAERAKEFVQEIKRKKLSEEKPYASSFIKRHRSFDQLMSRFIEKKRLELKSLLIEELEEDHWALKSNLIGKNLDKLFFETRKSVSHFKVADALKKFEDIYTDYLELLSNKELMMELVDGKFITKRMVNDLHEHTIYQMKTRSEESFREQTLDGASVDSGTKSALAGTLDEEDYAALLRLLQLKVGRIGKGGKKIKKFKHMVIDEAQEYSPIELKVLSGFLTDEGEVTIAGDAVQQVDPSLSFVSWDQILDDLNRVHVGERELSVAYRSPKSIVDFAYKILGPIGPANCPVSHREGPPVRIDHLQGRSQCSLLLYENLKDLIIREPRSSIAVICSNEDSARVFHEEIMELGEVRLVLAGEFPLRPGVDVTTVENIRGLEFDYVIVPDATALNYPLTDRSRKRLHLAVTRAIHQLWILSSGMASPLVTV